ncbi:MAG: hypothetical protein ACYTBJ_18020 [Planctomycetota bacterium]|jgi:hypothetical protein
MKVIEISDELYDRLKNCVVDPFDDTPEFVIGRLIDIVEKAKSKWVSWDSPSEEAEPEQESASEHKPTKKRQHWKEQADAIL